MTVDISSNATASERVASSLRGRISAGEWRPGEIIPGRRALAREYGVAAATMERAAGMLIAEGVLDASGRRGTFVSGRAPAPAVSPGGGGGGRRQPLAALVGIVAPVVPYSSPGRYAAQWSVQILAGLEHGLAGQAGITQQFQTLVPTLGGDLALPDVVEGLLAGGAEAIALVAPPSGLDQAIAMTAAAGVPLVCVSGDSIPLGVHHVHMDDQVGGAVAARHLLSRGYSRLAYLRPFASSWCELRLQGARSAATASGLRVVGPPAESLCQVETTTDQRRLGRELAAELFPADFEPGLGLIAPNDLVAMGVIDIAESRGLRLGADYGVIGFDDIHREAQLSSLRPPLEQLGQECARLLLRLLQDDAAPTSVALQHRLIARTSTVGPAA